MTSKLILCANHLGNPLDLPFRTAEALRQADLVLCEDTRSAGRLLASLGIKATLLSYFNYNEQKRSDDLKEKLSHAEMQVVLISESGLPLISDPGYRIVKLFHELGLPVEAVPGPSAFVTALSMSGFPLQRFQYVGFWPLKKGQQTKLLNEISAANYPFAFYESPKRILKSLLFIAQVLPDCQLFVVKELTKPYETKWRGLATDVAESMKTATFKGEFTVVVHRPATL